MAILAILCLHRSYFEAQGGRRQAGFLLLIRQRSGGDMSERLIASRRTLTEGGRAPHLRPESHAILRR